MQFTQGLHRAVQQQPDAIATIHGARQQSFQQLQSRVARFAGALQEQGFKKGDRIAILSLNSDRYLEAYLAIAWLGAVVNPINFRWSNAEVIYSLIDSHSVALIVDDNFAPQAAEIKAGSPSLRCVFYNGEQTTPTDMLSCDALIDAAAPIPDAEATGDDLLGVFYTGGTTGAPKGVMLSHANVFSSGLALLSENLFADHAVGLHAAPMFHLADMMVTISLLIRGGRHVFLSAFRPDSVLTLTQQHGITDLLLVPAMLQMVVDFPALSEFNTSSVRNIIYGASPASESLLDRTMQNFPTAALSQVYGMTEMSAVMTALPPAMHTPNARELGRLRSGGRSAHHVQVRIVDEHDKELSLGDVGEIIARGPNLMQGYLNQPDTTAETLRNGWMHTGDMGYMDSNGYVFIVDRSKDMIISGGENVYSVEVENAILKHPAIASAAVIGVPCEEMGEKVHAALVLKAGAAVSQEELYAHCKTLIAGYKCPRSISLLDALPISGAGKVLKTEIRKPFWVGLGRNIS